MDVEDPQCTICLQPFVDRAIIPVCAHEFCFECILLWADQSRKCPLCTQSFDNSYLIHHVRSQFDYQKHYLPPARTSPPPLTGESHANALRHTRRERQWGRRQRQQREDADQLERAISRRRWIYQHHLYAKHVASNPYTRYRPFPTPAQFAASPDLISRMTIFLRRELRVWPNLDVEFLTTYTISLMKSIDIRSESAVKLLSEFLDLDTPYIAGERHVNAEHFAHEIYSYLRSPYRDLFVYDQIAQYDTPSEVTPPREMERGSRWNAEPSSSRRSWSRSRSDSPLDPPRATTYHQESSVEASPESRPSRGLSTDHSTRGVAVRDHSDGVEHTLCNPHPYTGDTTYPDSSSSMALDENKNTEFPARSHLQSHGKGKAREVTPVFGAPGGDDHMLTAAESDNGIDYVAPVSGGSSANAQSSRKRPDVHIIHPRNRTLSGSVQAYLSKRIAPHSKPEKHMPGGQRCPKADARPSLLLRLSNGPNGPDIGNLTLSRERVATHTECDKPRIRTSEHQRLD